MKSSNRILIGFGIAVGVIAIVAVGLALATSGRPPELLPENTPEGTVQRFLLAMRDRDYPKAYTYVWAETDGKRLDYDSWRKSIGYFGDNSTWKATIGKTTVTGNEATVETSVDIFQPGGPFENPVRTNRVTFFLRKIEATWYITSPSNLWFIY